MQVSIEAPDQPDVIALIADLDAYILRAERLCAV